MQLSWWLYFSLLFLSIVSLNGRFMQFLSSLHFKSLYLQTLPMLIGLLAIMSVQLIDSVFIGMLGEAPLAIAGFSIAIFQLVVGVQVGIGIAATACISAALGRSERLHGRNLGFLVLVLGGSLLAVLCLALWWFRQTIIGWLGGGAELYQALGEYWLPWLMSCWLGAALYFTYSICRSFGQSLLPGKVMVITSVLNALLDPLFIFTFQLELAGAAWATCVAYLIGLGITFTAIKRQGFVALPSSLYDVKSGTSLLVRFTVPAMLSQFIPPVSALLVTSVVAGFGIGATGVWGLANRIEYILIILILAMTMAMPPMIGRLKGAGRYEEIYGLIKTAIVFIFLVQLLLALLMAGLAESLVAIFSLTGESEQMLEQYLLLVPISYGPLGVCMICVSASNAIGLPKAALLLSCIRLFACYLPLVWIGSQWLGFSGVLIGASTGNVLSGWVAWQLFKRRAGVLMAGQNGLLSFHRKAMLVGD